MGGISVGTGESDDLPEPQLTRLMLMVRQKRHKRISLILRIDFLSVEVYSDRFIKWSPTKMITMPITMVRVICSPSNKAPRPVDTTGAT